MLDGQPSSRSASFVYTLYGDGIVNNIDRGRADYRRSLSDTLESLLLLSTHVVRQTIISGDIGPR